MTRKLKTVLAAFLCFLPWRIRRVLLQAMFHWQLDKKAYIGLSLFYNVESLSLARGAYVGHFNVFRNLRRLELGENSFIGQWNWLTCSPMFFDPPLPDTGTLLVGRETALTSRHYLDCAGGIRIGSHTTLAGVRSTVMTHQIETVSARQTALPISVGDHCLVSSNVCMTPGASVADRCVVAMGAVVVGALDHPGMLYAGVPAREVKQVGTGQYFQREHGFIGRE